MKNSFKYSLNPATFLELNEACNVYCYDLHNNLIEANEHLIQMMNEAIGNINSAEILGKNAHDIFANIDPILKENELVITTGKAHQFYNRIKLGNRLLVFVTVKAPLYDQDKKIAGVFGISNLLSSYQVAEPIEKLTLRENQCLIELIKGKTAKEIAKKLHISCRTVESHLENVKGKLGCRNKSELIEKIYQKGLASLSEEPTTSEPFKSGLFLPVEIKINKK